MTDKTTHTSSSGAHLSAGPEQHLHVDHDSAVRREPASLGDESSVREAGDAAGRLYDRAADQVDGIRNWASGRYEDAQDHAADLADQGRESLRDLGDRGAAAFSRNRNLVEDFVSENPMLVGVVGLAAGLLIGALLPRTRQEDETLGHYAAEARDQGLRFAREAVHTGRAYVESALDQANEAMDGVARPQDGTANDGVRSGPSGRYQNH